MGFGDWLRGGGLFGGYGAYDGLSEEARERARRAGMFTAGASILGGAVGPINQGFMRNISQGLLAGREDFGRALDREAEMEELALRKKKLQELADEKLRQENEAEAARFAAQSEKDLARIDKLNTLLNKTGKSFEELNVLDDKTINDLYEGAIFPPEPKKPKIKIEGGREIRVDPDGNESFVRYLPAEPKPPKEVDPNAADDDREKWIERYADRLGRDTKPFEVPDAQGNIKTIRIPRIETYEERRALAEEAWEKQFGGKPSFSGVVSGGSSTGAPKAGSVPVVRDTAPNASAPITTDEGRTKMLVDRYGYDKARQMMIDAGGTVEEVEMLLRSLQRRYSSGGLRANPG